MTAGLAEYRKLESAPSQTASVSSSMKSSWLSATPDETALREQRRRAVVGRLDDLAHHLCAAARAGAANPQEDHRS